MKSLVGETLETNLKPSLFVAQKGVTPMMDKKSLYSKGDWIVHAKYGVGKIMGVEMKKIGAVEKIYFKVKTNNSLYWLPVDHANADYIRPIESPDGTELALRIIKSRPEELCDDHKERKGQIIEAFHDGSLIALARLIRDLSGRKLTQKRLNEYDVNVLERGKKRMVDEIVVGLGVTSSDANALLEKALQTSLESGQGD